MVRRTYVLTLLLLAFGAYAKEIQAMINDLKPGLRRYDLGQVAQHAYVWVNDLFTLDAD